MLISRTPLIMTGKNEKLNPSDSRTIAPEQEHDDFFNFLRGLPGL
jgi:hypothetical protein